MSEIQSVLFSRKNWKSKDARKWLDKKKLKRMKKVDKTENYLRYRINDPKKYKRFITKSESNGIKLIIGFRK